ncbi:MAG TPA: urea carboxylase-associated family protein [Candidatus Protoclostridium stercorigallinarum]|uniref:Urea carboxylase-associated family protein n=1 Tax=Candidatus Protoclostridium stercorigallinarum TaxID=2838741 RepID=A0A9D1Q218_9FIRM|nr:urea carboxylase-associated family protein [Candidatus Protoclostridium stercorigallinarum]
MKREYMIEPCTGMRIRVKKGSVITVTDVCGGQVADLFAETDGDASEFISPGVTIDVNGSLGLKIGDTVYSNRYRPMLRVIADDVGVHDLIHPCCRKEMYDLFYGNGEGHPNCLDNINGCLGRKYDIITPVNLFMNTAISPDGTLTVARPLSGAGDSIVFRAEEDIVIGVAACSVSESECNGGECTPIAVAVEE